MIVRTNKALITAAKKKSRTRCIVALILAVLFIIGVFSIAADMIRGVKNPDVDNPTGALIAGAVVTVACAVWFFAENKKGKTAGLADKYATILSLEEDGKIFRLAKSTGKSESVVIGNLNYMIGKGYLIDADIDSSKGEVVSRVYSEKEYSFVKCPACGGTSRIVKGESGTCEYCGSAIREE